MKDMGSYGETEVLWPRSDAVSPRVADVIDRVMSVGNDIKTERQHPFYPQSSVHSSPLPKEQDFKNYPHLNSTFNDSYKSTNQNQAYQDIQVKEEKENYQSENRPSSPAYSESEASSSRSPEFDVESPHKSFHYGDKTDNERQFLFEGRTPDKTYPSARDTSPNRSPNRSYPYGFKHEQNGEHEQSFNSNDTPESSPLKRYHSQERDRHEPLSPETPYSVEKSKYGVELPPTQFPFGLSPAFPRESLMHIKESIPASYPLPPIPQLNLSPGAGYHAEKTTRDGLSKYFCHLCNYAGDSKPDFDAHMSIHFEYSCPHCDYTSRTEGRLKRHIKDFHSDDNDGKSQRTMPGRPKVYRCKQCDFVATIKTEFWNHSKSHIKEDKILQCPRCPFVTEYKHHLEYHLRNHFGSKPFKCTKCNYSCVNKSMLNSHMKSHTNVYQYRCADCTYATKYCHSLKLHLRKYNHKPATVLNNDGSLPQGLDADISGLSLLAKRGPPRGPRGSKREEAEYMNSMFPFQAGGMLGMPGLPSIPGMNGGMMSPYWPIMSGWSPHLSMGTNRMPPLAGLQPNRMIEQGPAKCILCSFIAESHEKLNAHVMKVHAPENQDLFNAYGISSENLAEEAQKNRLRRKLESTPEGTPERPSSHSNMLHVRTDGGGENCKASPHSWPENTPDHHSSSTNISSRSLPELYSNGSMKEQNGKDEPDILRAMTLKFGSTNGTSPQDMDKEGALDLSKPRPESPLPSSYSSLKRSYPEQDLSSSAENSINGEALTPNPRKRSRKGKAYKLDTLCLKLQEGKSPYESESESEESNGDASAEMVSDARGSQHVNPTGDGGDSDGSNPLHINDDHYEQNGNYHHDADTSDHKTIIEFERIQANLKFISGQKDENNSVKENVECNEEEKRESPLDLLNSVYRKKPMSSALRRGAEVAWKILNDPTSGEKPLMNGEVTDIPPSPTHPVRRDSTNLTPSPPVKRQMKECTFCDIAFRDCVMYNMHMMYHGNQNPYKCNMCGDISRDKVEFFLHIARSAHN